MTVSFAIECHVSVSTTYYVTLVNEISYTGDKAYTFTHLLSKVNHSMFW